MSLQAEFVKKLATLSGSGSVRLNVDVPPRRLACEIAQQDSLALAIDQLELRTTELASAVVSDLQRLSETLSASLNYLLEPITPIEADADQCVVQMRSNPPRQEDDGRSYYELIVSRDRGIALRRYRKGAGQSRQPVPATLTREVLQRIVADFDQALDQFSP